MNLAVSKKRWFVFIMIGICFGTARFVVGAATPAETAEAGTPEAADTTPAPADPTQDETDTEEPTVTKIPEKIAKPAAEKPAAGKAPEKRPPAPQKGIDTIQLEDSGNWFFKRKTLEEAFDVVGFIVSLLSKIVEASASYKIKANKLDAEYEIYSMKIGFSLGDLNQVISNLLANLEQERQKEGELSAEERQALTELKGHENELKQLREDLNALNALDQEKDKVVETVDSQIRSANNYQNQAWRNLEEIKKVLSDEKAEELYYRTTSLQKNMQDIYTYLTGTLSAHFSSQIDTMHSKMDVIKSKLQTLKAKGLDLKKKVADLEKEDEEQDQAELQAQQEAAIKKALQTERAKHQKAGWWAWTKHIVTWPFVQVSRLSNFLFYVASTPFRMIGRLFGRKASPPKVTPEAVAEKPVAGELRKGTKPQ